MAAGWQNGESSVGWSFSEKPEDTETPSHAQSDHHHHHHWEMSLHDAQDWFDRRKSSSRKRRRSSLVLERTVTGKKWWKFTLRPWDDDEYSDWWFAGTAIPLLAATIGPLANVFSIAALVTYWRMCTVEGGGITSDAAQCVYDGDRDKLLAPLYGHPFKDPSW